MKKICLILFAAALFLTGCDKSEISSYDRIILIIRFWKIRRLKAIP